MKKIMILFAIFAMFFLVSCGGSNDKEKEDETTDTGDTSTDNDTGDSSTDADNTETDDSDTATEITDTDNDTGDNEEIESGEIIMFLPASPAASLLKIFIPRSLFVFTTSLETAAA